MRPTLEIPTRLGYRFLESGPVRDETFFRYRVDGSREPLPGPYFRWPDRELLSHYLSVLPDPAPEDTNRASFKDSITHIAFPHHSLYEGDISPSRGPPFDWLRDALPNLQNISVVSGQTWGPHYLFDPARSGSRMFEPEWDQLESFRDDPRFKDDRRLWKLLRRPELPLCLEPMYPTPQDSRDLRRLEQVHSTWPEEDAEDAGNPAWKFKIRQVGMLPKEPIRNGGRRKWRDRDRAGKNPVTTGVVRMYDLESTKGPPSSRGGEGYQRRFSKAALERRADRAGIRGHLGGVAGRKNLDDFWARRRKP